MVQLQRRKGTLGPRTQRGGRAFVEADEWAHVVSEYATLFLDRVPEAMAQQLLQEVITQFGAPDSELTRRLTDATAKAIMRKIRGSLPKTVEELVAKAGPLITRLSQVLVRTIPGATEETVSAEVAKRLDTTIQGAHAWMVRPILAGQGSKTGPGRFALEVLRVEAAYACREHGTADSLRVWYRRKALLTGAPSYGDALAAINKGCRR